MLGTLFDAYDRPARLYPALLCLVPIVGVGAGVHGTALTLSSGLMSFAASFGLLAWFTSISRDMGKRLEEPLYAQWGGKPTTQLLRHRFENTVFIDSLTRKRYHDFLGKHLNTTFPTQQQERDAPKEADDVYEGGGRFLLEKTRDKAKYPLVFKELVQYGAARNRLGLKPIGIFVAVASLLWAMFCIGVISMTGFAFDKLVDAPLGAKLSLLTSVAMASGWTFFVTKGSVRRVAFAYAMALLRCCDKLPKKK